MRREASAVSPGSDRAHPRRLGAPLAIAAGFPALRDTVQASRAITLSEAGRLDEARAELDAFAATRFERMPRNLTWILNTAYFAEAAARVGHAGHAAVLYEQLRPFEKHHVILPPLLSYGPVAHQLAILAGTLGDVQVAERHFQHALEGERRMRSAHWSARTKVEYGLLLLRRGGREAEDAARTMLRDARLTAERLNLPGLVARADGAGIATVPGAVRRCTFRPEGAAYLVSDGGTPIAIEKTDGMDYLHELLLRPGRRVWIHDLDTLVHGSGGFVESALDPALDARGRADLEARLKVLVPQRNEAEANDDRRVEQLNEEIERITNALLGGSRPQAGGADESRRGCVYHAIKTAKRRIRPRLSTLADHLDRHVVTGWSCMYAPHPQWVFEL